MQESGEETSAAIDAAGAVRGNLENPGIDFHSADFNRVDNLSDCAQDYHSFQTLEGVVTAHERHQREIRRRREPEPPPEEPAPPGKNRTADDDLDAPEMPSPLTVISAGRTLIIDTDAARGLLCGQALHGRGLTCALIVAGNPLANTAASTTGGMKYLDAERVSVSGAFGGFSARVTAGGSEGPLSAWFDDGGFFDLVLDLQPVPSFAGGRLPIGYYAPGSNPAALAEAMAELPEMRGRFKKPQFVVFHKDRCLHGRSRGHDCRRCVEICPYQAIRAAETGISINPYLCQGCGGCALVCSAGAIRTAQPSLEDLRTSLESRAAGGSSSIRLVISDAARLDPAEFPAADGRPRGRRIFFRVDPIAHVRLEMLLTALAGGAGEILVACDIQNPPAIREAVHAQVMIARAVLRGLNLGEDKVQFRVVSSAGNDSLKTAPRPDGVGEHAGDGPPEAVFRPAREERTVVYRSAQVLNDHSGEWRSWIPLPADSPFGTLAINPDACTLCLACAAACPSGALSSDGRTPRLLFQEFRCHQCGLCRGICPEDAIRLVPRLLLDIKAAERQTVLRKTEPFRCISCGAPFAAPVMVDRIKERLAGHWMYATERQQRLLKMCRTCRTRDALTSPEMFRWNR